MNLEADSSPVKPPGENTAQLTLDCSLMRPRAVPQTLVYRNPEEIKRYCFKLLKLWSFLMQQQKTNKYNTNLFTHAVNLPIHAVSLRCFQ